MHQSLSVAFDADGTAVYSPINPNYNGNNNNNGSGNNNNNVFDVPSLQVVSDSGGGFNSEPMKRQRGRLRKYSMLGGGSLNTGYNNQQQNQSQSQNQNQNQVFLFNWVSVTYSTPPQHAASEAAGPVAPTSGKVKKPRGRPPGSLNKKPSSAGREYIVEDYDISLTWLKSCLCFVGKWDHI